MEDMLTLSEDDLRKALALKEGRGFTAVIKGQRHEEAPEEELTALIRRTRTGVTIANVRSSPSAERPKPPPGGPDEDRVAPTTQPATAEAKARAQATVARAAAASKAAPPPLPEKDIKSPQ